MRKGAISVAGKAIVGLASYRIASRHDVLEKGRTVWQGSPAELRADASAHQRYLGA